MASEGIPTKWVEAFQRLHELAARPPVVFTSIREAADDMGYPPREIRRWLYTDDRVTAKKKPGSRLWTEIAVPYLWYHGSPKQRRMRKNKERREKRAAQLKERKKRARKRRSQRRTKAKSK